MNVRTVLPVFSHLYPPPSMGRPASHPGVSHLATALGLILWYFPPHTHPASEAGQLLNSNPVSSMKGLGSGPGQEMRREEVLVWAWPMAALEQRVSLLAEYSMSPGTPQPAVNATLSKQLTLLLGYPCQPRSCPQCPLHPPPNDSLSMRAFLSPHLILL